MSLNSWLPPFTDLPQTKYFAKFIFIWNFNCESNVDIFRTYSVLVTQRLWRSWYRFVCWSLVLLFAQEWSSILCLLNLWYLLVFYNYVNCTQKTKWSFNWFNETSVTILRISLTQKLCFSTLDLFSGALSLRLRRCQNDVLGPLY